MLVRFLAIVLAAGWLSSVPAHGQDPAAERLYREAQRLSRQGDAEAALEEFQLLLQQFPRDRLAPTALLDMVRLLRMADDRDGTRAGLDKLLADYPRSVESAAGFVLQAELELEAAGDEAALEEARKTFRRVPLLYGPERYPVLPDRTMARIRSAEVNLRLGDPEAAIAELLAAVVDEPPSLWTGRARLSLGDALLRTGDWLAAAEILQRLASAAAPTSTEGVRKAAARRLRFIDRHYLRPLTGQKRWLSTARFPGSGLALQGPSAVAAAEDGRVLIVDRRARLVAAVAADGTVLDRRSVEDPRRPAWRDGAWPLLATDTHVAQPFEGQRTSFSDPRPDRDRAVKDLLAAERNAFGTWFLLSDDWKGLLVYDDPRRGKELMAENRPQLEDLAQDDRGRIYVLDRKTKTVTRLGADRQRQEIVVSGPGWRRPTALDVDRAGNVYVLDRGNRTVEVYGADGRRLTSLGPVLGGGIELKNPVDLAVDGGGRLFIADEKLPFLVVLE
ncbi:MAG: hypothetical protein V3T72_11195 [Thermoanaerobaculia bacterium]